MFSNHLINCYSSIWYNENKKVLYLSNQNINDLIDLKKNLLNKYLIQKEEINNRIKYELEQLEAFKLLKMECLYNNIKFEILFNNDFGFEVILSINEKQISISHPGTVKEINLQDEIEDEVLKVVALSFKNDLNKDQISSLNPN